MCHPITLGGRPANVLEKRPANVLEKRPDVLRTSPYGPICNAKGDASAAGLPWDVIRQTISIKIFKGCLPQILLGPCLNILSHSILFPLIVLQMERFWPKGTIMQIEKALITDRLHVSKVCWKFRVPNSYNFEVIYPWNLLFF